MEPAWSGSDVGRVPGERRGSRNRYGSGEAVAASAHEVRVVKASVLFEENTYLCRTITRINWNARLLSDKA